MKEPLYCQPACNARFAAALHSHSTCNSGLAQADAGMQGLCTAVLHMLHLGIGMWFVSLERSVASDAQSSRVMPTEIAKQSKELEHIDR